jgi:hypothetical protein
MSNTATAGLAMALALLTMAMYVYVDKWVQTQTDAVVSGVVRGVAVSAYYRRKGILVRWILIGAVQTLLQVVWGTAWWAFAENVDVEAVRLLAHMLCFIFFCSALIWLGYMPYWYYHLAAILRQAEAE